MANLTPQQLAEIRRLLSTPIEQGDQNSRAPSEVMYDGQQYMPNWTGGFTGYDAKSLAQSGGDRTWAGDMYDAQGNNTGKTSVKSSDSILDSPLIPLAFMLGPMALTAMGAGGAATAAGLNSFDSGAMMGMIDGSGAGLGGAGAGGGLGALNGFDSGVMGDLVTGGPMAQSVAAGTAGAGGALSAAAKAAASSGLLGPAATLLGGLAGAQGQKTSQTAERKTDPRVDPYLFGANGQPGLLQMTYNKLAQQMAPGGLPGYDDMQSVGRGLLKQPVVGNGFARFFGK